MSEKVDTREMRRRAKLRDGHRLSLEWNAADELDALRDKLARLTEELERVRRS